MTSRTAIAVALLSAALFGASTPLASVLLPKLAPLVLAALLYLGSGIGLSVVRATRDAGFAPTGLHGGDWPWLAGSIIAGGIAAPALLMYGLSRAGAASTSLLLNLEPAFTALLAWTVFREHVGRRLILGMALIVAGGVILGARDIPSGGSTLGADVCIALACLGWAVDNNLTRNVAHADALFLAALKGLAAGITNLLLATLIGQSLPAASLLAAALLLGFCSFGLSLVLFIIALRELGSARAGAYFAAAPFMGALIAVLWLHSPTSAAFWVAAALMALGIWLHLTEKHEHEHSHEGLTHVHTHSHDPHHQHAHPFPWNDGEPHVHEHVHARLRHRHAHFPDLHHRHDH